MSTINNIDLPALSVNDNKITTSSISIANAFTKEHKNLVAKIKSLECSDQFLTANFSAVNYEHKGNIYNQYQITKNGFMFLVMGFTGKKAARIKEAYINAFDQMAEKIKKADPNCICALATNEPAETKTFDKTNLNIAMFTILNMVSQIDETYDLNLFNMTSFKMDFQNNTRQINK